MLGESADPCRLQTHPAESLPDEFAAAPTHTNRAQVPYCAPGGRVEVLPPAEGERTDNRRTAYGQTADGGPLITGATKAPRSTPDVEHDCQRLSSRNGSTPMSDRALVDRCLAGDVLAWEDLYGKCQPPLLLAIRVFLGRNASKQDLVEDIAAKVWFTVIDGKSNLLNRFDSGRGCRLTTFLAGVAKNEVSRHFRAERRRQSREAIASWARSSTSNNGRFGSLASSDVALNEFLTTLTPREREFCEGHLLGAVAVEPTAYTPANRWQLQHRVRSKLWKFLQQE